MATLTLTIRGQDESHDATRTVERDLRDVGDAADDAGKKGGGFFKGMLQGAGSFLAADVMSKIAGQVAGFALDAFDAARGTAQLMASTQQTIDTMGNAAGRSAQEVADLAASLSDASGKSLFGDDQIQQSQNLLLTFGEIKGETFDLASALTVDLAAALGGAPKDQAMMLGKALNDPIHGMSALGKAGLTFSEEQKAAITAMQESGDMAGAQAVIIAELNKQVGGQAEAQAKAAGGMVQFQARMGEAAETVATALLPIIEQVAGVLVDYVAPAIETAAVWLGENLPAAIETAQGYIDAVIGAFSSAGEGGGELGDMLGELGDIWDGLGELVDEVVKLIEATVVPIFTTIAGFLSDHKTEITAIVTAAWTIIKTAIDTALTLIKGIIKTATQLISGDWSGAWDTIKETFSKVWSNIKTIAEAELTIFKNILSMAWDAVKEKVEALVEKVKAIPGQLLGAGAAIVQAVWDGMKAKWDELVGWFNEKLQALKDKLPFSEPKDSSSPLHGLAKAGESIIAQIQSGIAGAGALQIGAPLIGSSTGGGGRGGGGARGGASVAGGLGAITINVDARGASDPQAIEAAAKRGANAALDELGRQGLIRQRLGGY
jgi:hypothetical protein